MNRRLWPAFAFGFLTCLAVDILRDTDADNVLLTGQVPMASRHSWIWKTSRERRLAGTVIARNRWSRPADEVVRISDC